MRRLIFFVAWALLLLASPAGAVEPYLLPDGDEVVLSPTIQAKADELGRDPVRIYEFVHNELAYEIYYGLLKGPEGTLRSGGGNDYDLSALLVSLLRASQIRTRFVRGRIQVPEADALAWTGALSLDAAVAVFNAAEPRAWVSQPHLETSASAGTFEAMHIWVEAEVPMAAYRGAAPETERRGMVWVPLAPGYQLKDWNPVPTPPLPLGSPALEFDYFSEDGLYAKVRSKLPVELLEDQIRAYLANQSTGSAPPSLDEIAGTGQIRKEVSGVLPNHLPFELSPLVSVGRDWRLKTLHRPPPIGTAPPGGGQDPSDYNYQLRISACVAGTPNCLALPATDPNKLLSHGQHNTAEETIGWNGKRLSIGFPFVDPSDVPPDWHNENTAPCDGISGQPLQVRTAFLVDGVEVTPTNLAAVDVCTSVDIYFVMALPSRNVQASVSGLGYFQGSRVVTYTVGAEGVYVVAHDFASTSAGAVATLTDSLADEAAEYPLAIDTPSGATFIDAAPGGTPAPTDNNGVKDPNEIFLAEDFALRERLVGGLLHLGSAWYYEAENRGFDRINSLHHKIGVKTPHVGLVSSGRRVEALDDVPFGLGATNLVIDLKIRWAISADRTVPDFTIDHAFMLGVHQASALEHAVWEELGGAEGVSTVKGLQLGSEVGDREVLMLTPVDVSGGEAVNSAGQGPLTYCIIMWSFGAQSESTAAGCGPVFSGTTTELRVLDQSLFSYFDWNGWVYVRTTTGGVDMIISPAGAGGGYATSNFSTSLSTRTSGIPGLRSLPL